MALPQIDQPTPWQPDLRDNAKLKREFGPGEKETVAP